MRQLLSICLLLMATPALADNVATVLFTAKDVSLNRTGAQSKLARGGSLQTGDAIITAAESSAKIKYANGTLVSIGENSNYKILAYSPNQGDVEIAAELKSGKIESKTTGQKKETLKTPVIALAILGTQYKVYVPNEKKTYTIVQSGKIEAGNMILTAGKSAVSTTSGTTSTPFPAKGNILPRETTQNGTEPVGGGNASVDKKDNDSNDSTDSGGGGGDSGGGDGGGGDSGGGGSGGGGSGGGFDAGVSGAMVSSLVETTVIVSSSTVGAVAGSVADVAIISIISCLP